MTYCLVLPKITLSVSGGAISSPETKSSKVSPSSSFSKRGRVTGVEEGAVAVANERVDTDRIVFKVVSSGDCPAFAHELTLVDACASRRPYILWSVICGSRA